MSVTGTPGTGTITLNAAISGYQTFTAAGAQNGETVSYLAVDGSSWEIGRGVYTSAGTTLSRGMLSSSSGSAISLTSSAIIAIVVLSEDMSLMETLLTQAVNQVINAGCGVYAPDNYEIANSINLEIGSGSVLEIG